MTCTTTNGVALATSQAEVQCARYIVLAVLRWWSGWKRVLVVVRPETVVRWHRAGFRRYWTWLSRHQVRTGRKRVSREVRELIFRMLAENPTWGAPRIHGELQMLGFDLSQRTASRGIQRAPRNSEPAKRGLTFLRNHRELIAAMDFFTVPTFTFGVLYCFFVVAHDRRRILHFNVTRMPTSSWVVQQLREAFPYDSTHKYLIFDRDAKFGFEVIEAAKAFGSKPLRTSYHSPWQNGVAERWVGSCRRDLLDHVILMRAGLHVKHADICASEAFAWPAVTGRTKWMMRTSSVTSHLSNGSKCRM